MDMTLLTGACGGLGSAFAHLLAARGEPLLLTGRSRERLDALARALAAQYSVPLRRLSAILRTAGRGRHSFTLPMRRKSRSPVSCMWRASTRRRRRKTSPRKNLSPRRASIWRAPVSLMRGVFLRRSANGICEFLAIGSMSGVSPMPYFALYSATKKALEQYCIALHTEWMGRAKVTVVLPGGIPTRQDIRENIAAHGWFGKVSALPPETVAARALRAVAGKPPPRRHRLLEQIAVLRDAPRPALVAPARHCENLEKNGKRRVLIDASFLQKCLKRG